MTGRRRHLSTSSVETVDESQIRWRQETSVLKSVRKDEDPNEWPIFELRDATVWKADGTTLENALEVGTRGPFIVRGHLVVEDDHEAKQHLLMRVRSSTPIEIRQCVNYSMGEVQDGRPLIWVSGRAGWYELNPSPTYRAIYNHMCEATTLYYRIMDIYNTKKLKRGKKGKGGSLMDELSQLFLQYAILVGDGSTFDEVVQRCTDHAAFFIWQFTQEDADFFNWKTTGFYKWITTEQKDVYDKAMDFVKNPRPPPRMSTTSRSPPPPMSSPVPLRSRGKSPASAGPAASFNTQEEKVDSKDFAMDQQSRPQRPTATEQSRNTSSSAAADIAENSAQNAASAPQDADENDAAFHSVLNALEWAREQLADSKHGMTVSGVINKLYFTYSFPNFKNGTVASHRIPIQEVLHYNAAALLKKIDKSKYEGHEIYGALQQWSKTKFAPIALKPSQVPFTVMPRRAMARAKKADVDVAEMSQGVSRGSSSQRNSGHPTRGGKSGKRHGAGRKSSLRLPTSRKRLHSEFDEDSEMEDVDAKKSHFFTDEDNSMQDAADDNSDNDSSASSDEDANGSAEAVNFVIRSESIPSTIPQGPQDTWVCAQEDCGFIVRNGNEEEGQERIRAHFREHEQQVERVHLAVAESRGHMPINHLLEKLRNIGDKSQAAQQLHLDDVPITPPIKRKLIV